MITVTTKEELEQALMRKEQHIQIKGELAKKIAKKKKIKSVMKIAGGVLFVAGIALVPFTGGTSLALNGLTVATGTGTTIALSTAEVAIVAGLGALGLSTASLALLKGYSFEYDKDGSIRLTKK